MCLLQWCLKAVFNKKGPLDKQNITRITVLEEAKDSNSSN